ncbi:hypothetical protein [Massilia sp. TS11]|uniref:hypothetical protein n=1 Tax=Massilia sp. TS11 TaxID=2908003 RepID=UPI001EDB4EA0|nr:hypothetical protein [Massilia sp. TS11]MCG2583710.1 hypothetical protein [Massilia sp. TS11]
MPTIPEALHAQLNALGILAHEAFANAEKLAALQVRSARAQLQHSQELARKLWIDQDPAALFQVDWARASALGHGLSEIASGTQAALLRAAGAAFSHLPRTPQAPAAPRALPAVASAATSKPASKPAIKPVVKPAKASKKPLVAKAAPVTSTVPKARAKPVAKAVAVLEGGATAPAKPAAFPVPSTRRVAVPRVKPEAVDPQAPPKPVAVSEGPAAKTK